MRRWWRRVERVTAEQARQITGIATPFGGISWADRGPTETETVRTFILFLEDRRVLYNAMDLEVVSQVEGSIHEIRGQPVHTDASGFTAKSLSHYPGAEHQDGGPTVP